MIGAKPVTAEVTLTTTATTTVLAGPAAGINRYVRHIKVVNGGAASSYTLGKKATTTAPAAGDPGLIANARPIAANSSEDIPFGGDGWEWLASESLNLNGSAADATRINVLITYYEVVA